MKVHDNTVIGRFVVVLPPDGNLPETYGSIEVLGNVVGSSDLQKDVSRRTFQEGRNELTADPVPPKPGCDGQVQQLVLSGSGLPADEKSHNPAIEDRNQEIVAQVVSRIPVGRFGTLRLDGADCLQISGA